MCVNKPQGGVDLIRARHSSFIQLVQVAVVSARLHAPSLAPYVLYVHAQDQPFTEVDDLSRYVQPSLRPDGDDGVEAASETVAL